MISIIEGNELRIPRDVWAARTDDERNQVTLWLQARGWADTMPAWLLELDPLGIQRPSHVLWSVGTGP